MGESNEAVPASLLRRCGAMLYDTFLVIAMLIAITFLFVPFLDGRVLVPEEVGALAYLYRFLQLVAIGLFFGFFWTHRGQTIGMLAWRLRIEMLDGSQLRWNAAAQRLGFLAVLLLPFFIGDWLVWQDWPHGTARNIAMALSLTPFASSFLWSLIDREHLTWHDRWSRTRMVVTPKAG